jgi:hypothetical protein
VGFGRQGKEEEVCVSRDGDLSLSPTMFSIVFQLHLLKLSLNISLPFIYKYYFLSIFYDLDNRINKTKICIRHLNMSKTF